MSNIYAISLNGVCNAEQRLDGAAHRIVKTGLSSPEISGGTKAGSDIASDLVDLKQAEIAGKANLRALSTQDELEKDALNLFA
jgi:predicted Zn-dependent protease